MLIILEDDEVYAHELSRSVSVSEPGMRVEIISSESAFVAALERGAFDRAQLIIIDMMLRWRPPGLQVEDPRQPNEWYKAGERALEALRRRSATRATPVIIHSVVQLPESELDRLRSISDAGYLISVGKLEPRARLLSQVHAILTAVGSPPGRLTEGRTALTACMRGHTFEASEGLSERYCPMCGAPVIAACPACSGPFTTTSLSPGLSDAVGDFCTACGAPMPWVDLAARRRHVENLLQYDNLDPDTQLSLIEDLATLCESGNEDEAVAAGESLRRLAPTTWRFAQPILQATLEAALKARLGL